MINIIEQGQQNRPGRLLALSIIIVASFITVGFFFFDVRQERAGEQDLNSNLVIDDQQPKQLKARLPVNKTIKSLAELRELQVAEVAANTGPLGPAAPIVLLEVPFISQAPFGEWSDPRQDYGCEEASSLMVWHWLNGQLLTKSQARDEIIAMSEWQLENYGEFRDSSAFDTAERFKKYFDYEQVRLVYDITIADLKAELAQGQPVLVPVNGQKLANPYFTPPGPKQHMVVVTGYDDVAQEFITNDPGTRRGESFLYSYQNLADSLRDYQTGYNQPVEEVRSAMIVVDKK